MKSQQNESGVRPLATSLHLAAKAQWILEYADGALAAPDAVLMKEHLQSCAECRAFHERALQLNTRLERGIKCNDLSPSFTARLRQRIKSAGQTEAAYFEQKQRMQMEFEQCSARLRKQLFRLPNLLDAISYSIAILMACYLVLAGFDWFTGMLGQSWPSLREYSWLPISTAIMLASIAVGLSVGLKNQHGPSSEEM